MFILPDNCIFIDVDDTLIIEAKPNYKLIEKIKEWKDKKKTIILWTSNSDGVKHAVKAARFCRIEDEVDFIMPKPYVIVDDDHLEYYRIINPLTLE